MKIELVFVKRSNGFDDGTLIVGKFPTKKAAYYYVKDNRRYYSEGYFELFITKKYSEYYEHVKPEDILNLKP